MGGRRFGSYVQYVRRGSPSMPVCVCAAGEPGGPLYYKEVLTRFLLEFFYPHDSERECDRTIGSFGHQSGITREQLSLPLASPPSPSGIRGILWVVQSIDLWLVSPSLDDTHEVQRSPPRWPLRKAPRPRRTHRRGLSRLRDRPQLRLRANKLPSPNHCESRDFLLVFKNLSPTSGRPKRKEEL